MRPSPLKTTPRFNSGILVSQNSAGLTPRTPHSSHVQASEYDEDDLATHGSHEQSQNLPLLASSTTPLFPPSRLPTSPSTRHRPLKDYGGAGSSSIKSRIRQILGRAPLVAGILAALLLAGLIYVSWTEPDRPLSAIGEDLPKNATNLATNATVETPLHNDDHAADAPMGIGHGHAHPAISYASFKSFPLTPQQYVEECWKQNQNPHQHAGYWATPPDGVIPDVPHKNAPGVCTSSITYMFDGRIGLMSDLALMAQAAGLAREQNRTFFVNDQYWNRGKWSDHFEDVRIGQPGPEPGCTPPPPEELVACPRLAKHWIITAHSAKFHFGHDFADAFEDPYAREINRQRPIFERARLSLNTTIVPNRRVSALIRTAIEEMGTKISGGAADYMAVHIRRGDRKTMSWQYHGGFVPIQDYVQVLGDASARLTLSQTYVATDSPDALAEFEKSIQEKTQAKPPIHSLGGNPQSELKKLASDRDYVQAEWDQRAEEERVRLTTGVIVDFAMISGFWTAGGGGAKAVRPRVVICTITSAICNLAAVGLGWDSFIAGDWIEIDNKGSVDPTWEAFRMKWP